MKNNCGDVYNVNPKLCNHGYYIIKGEPFPGVTYIGTHKIALEDIYVDSVLMNSIRTGGITEHDINKLVTSFKLNGVNYSKRPPVIKRCGRKINGKYYSWELVLGFTRIACFSKLEVKEYIFDEYSFDSLIIEKSFRLHENDEDDPKTPASIEDLAAALSELVDDGLIEDNKEAFKKYLNEYQPNTKKPTAVVNRVALMRGVEKKYQYNAKQARDYVSEKLPEIEFKNTKGWNTKTDRPVKIVSLNETDIYRSVGEAISNYRKYHKITEFIIYLPNDSNGEVNEERKIALKFLSTFLNDLVYFVNDLYSSRAKPCWQPTWVLPQSIDSENYNNILSFDDVDV